MSLPMSVSSTTGMVIYPYLFHRRHPYLFLVPTRGERTRRCARPPASTPAGTRPHLPVHGRVREFQACPRGRLAEPEDPLTPDGLRARGVHLQRFFASPARCDREPAMVTD